MDTTASAGPSDDTRPGASGTAAHPYATPPLQHSLVQATRECVHAHPTTAVAGAFLLGVVVGLLAGRRR